MQEHTHHLPIHKLIFKEISFNGHSNIKKRPEINFIAGINNPCSSVREGIIDQIIEGVKTGCFSKIRQMVRSGDMVKGRGKNNNVNQD